MQKFLKNFGMHFTKLPYEEFVKNVSTLISNSLSDNEIVTATSRFGYDKNRIKMGERLLKELISNDKKQTGSQDKKIKLHEKRAELKQSVKKKYMKILLIARIAFDKDQLVKRALKLDGARETELNLWIDQISVFANTLLSEASWLNMLKNYGIGRKEIHALTSDLDKLRSTAMLCEQAKTEAKKTTQEKRNKLKEMQNWISDFLKIAKIALEDKTEVYEKLRMGEGYTVQGTRDTVNGERDTANGAGYTVNE